MNTPARSSYDDFSRASCVRKGTLFGLAAGMLIGLFWIGTAPPSGGEIASIDRWGKVIVAGGALGGLIGLFWPRPGIPKSSNEDQASGPAEPKSNSEHQAP